MTYQSPEQSSKMRNPLNRMSEPDRNRGEETPTLNVVGYFGEKLLSSQLNLVGYYIPHSGCPVCS